MDEHLKKLTIIIPFYNSFESTKNLLNSIGAGIKVIIVDDASRTSESQALEQLAQSSDKYTVIRNESNLGAGYCRNVGIDKSKTEWLLFCDSDDLMTRNWKEVCSEAINLADDTTDVIYFPPSGEQNRSEPYRKLTQDWLDAFDTEAIRYKYYVPWSKLVRKSLISSKSIHFEEIKVSNDVMFSTLIGHHAREINVVDQEIYSVSKSIGGLTGLKNKERANIRIHVVCKLNNFLRSVDKVKYQISYTRVILNYFKSIGFLESVKYFFVFCKNGWKLKGL